MRLDRFLSNLPHCNRQTAQLLLAGGRVRVDGQIVRDGRCEVGQFSRVELDEAVLQTGTQARYLMLHKPVGVVSATRHAEHRTVIDLLDLPCRDELHLAGRLDLNTSGLLLLTNDGHWSRRLTLPASKQPKVYRVHTAEPIAEACIEAFARGLYFAYEDLITRPAQLEILDSHQARLTLTEGRYHQIKRMFGHFRNPVVALHRERIGNLSLGDLPCGAWRPLTCDEIAALRPSTPCADNR